MAGSNKTSPATAAKTAKQAPAKAEAPAAKPASEAAEPRKAKPAESSPPEGAATPAPSTQKAEPAPAPEPKNPAPAEAGAAHEEGAEKMTSKTKEAAASGQFAADQINAVFGDVNERAKQAMERSARMVEEMADLTRGNVEAFVASSKAAAKGVETLSQEAAEYGRRSFEEASAALKGFADVKSATDFFKLQSDYARSAFDSIVAENAKLSETMIKVAGEVAEPITSRYSVAAERVKNVAA